MGCGKISKIGPAPQSQSQLEKDFSKVGPTPQSQSQLEKDLQKFEDELKTQQEKVESLEKQVQLLLQNKITSKTTTSEISWKQQDDQEIQLEYEVKEEFNGKDWNYDKVVLISSMKDYQQKLAQLESQDNKITLYSWQCKVRNVKYHKDCKDYKDETQMQNNGKEVRIKFYIKDSASFFSGIWIEFSVMIYLQYKVYKKIITEIQQEQVDYKK